ncbi:uncharacterized protein M6D78_017546 [Vipera latastei]
MAGDGQTEGSTTVTFDDVVVYFSPDEWQSLTKDQKQLYWEVLQENYQALLLVGQCPITLAEVLAWVENKERLNIPISSRLVEDPLPAIFSKGNEDRSQMDVESFPEKVGPLESIFTLSEEEASCCSHVEGQPEQSCVSASEQGSVPDSGGHLRTESAERASGDEDRSQMDAESFWEKVGPLESIFTLSEEEAPVSSHVAGHPEQSRVSASEQGSVPDSGGHLWAESAEWDSGAARAADVPPLWVEPVVAPEKSAKLLSCPRRTTILHQRNFAVKGIQFARTTRDEKCVDSRRQALARSTGKMTQDTLSSSPEVPPEAEKLYSCAWCKEPFKLRMNLDVHYRYCRQRAKQQARPASKPRKSPSGQDVNELSRTGKSTGSVPLPEKPAHYPSSVESKEAFLHFRLCQPHQRQRAGKSSAENPRSLLTTSATKKLCRCLECGEKFVYKWQLSTHRQSCRKVAENKKDPLPKPRYLAAKEQLPGSAKGQESCVVAPARRSGTGDKALHPCGQCGKRLSKSYLATHLAFHAGERYKCLLCGKLLNFQSGAVRHKRQHCKNEEGGTCQKCGKQAGAQNCFCMIQKIRVAPDSDWEK